MKKFTQPVWLGLLFGEILIGMTQFTVQAKVLPSIEEGSDRSRIHVAVLPHELKRNLREISSLQESQAISGFDIGPAVSVHLHSYQKLKDMGRFSWKNAKRILKESPYLAALPLVGLVPKLVWTGKLTGRDFRWAFLVESGVYVGYQGALWLMGQRPHKLKLVGIAKRREDRACLSWGFQASDSSHQILKTVSLTEGDFKSGRVFINGHVLTPELAEQRGWLKSEEPFLVYQNTIQCKKKGSKLYALDAVVARDWKSDLL